jgi:hypothetical protein
MNKTDQFIISPLFRFFIQQNKPQRPQTGHFCVNILHLESDMMDAFPLFFDEFGDDPLGICAFEELDLCVTL